MAPRAARRALNDGPGDRRAVRGADAAGVDAAGDRLRRAGIPPPGAEGVLPGRADRVPAAQRLHEHAVRGGDAPPPGHGGHGRLVVGGAGGPTARRAVRPGRRRADRLHGDEARELEGRLPGRGRLPHDPLDLPAGGDRVRRGPPLRVPGRPALGLRPGPDRARTRPGAALGPDRLPRGRGDGLQVHGGPAVGPPVRGPERRGFLARPVVAAGGRVRPGLGRRHDPLDGEERPRHRQPGLPAGLRGLRRSRLDPRAGGPVGPRARP